MIDDRGIARSLNQTCHCIQVDRASLSRALDAALSEIAPSSLDAQGLHSRLFADSPVFVARQHLDIMAATVGAIHKLTASTAWLQHVSEKAPSGLLAAAQLGGHLDPRSDKGGGADGVFVSADFHLTEQGPRLIEMNTNAGGGLLALYQARAQEACCVPIANATTGTLGLGRLEEELVAMFQREHFLSVEAGSHANAHLRTVAIVDDDPPGQFLYPEMQLFRELFERHGIKAMVVASEELELREVDGRRRLVDRKNPETAIDLVYNRLTDFYFEEGTSQALRSAWLDNAVTVTPNPWTYARLADKRNLPLFLDEELQAAAELSEVERDLLNNIVPPARIADSEDAEALWAERKHLFFKPLQGYGSRGAFNGAKITRKVFAQCLEQGFLAQQKVPPSERVLLLNGELQTMKVDLRAIAYNGVVQFHIARMYRGQTTNLRTDGGGLATVLEINPQPPRKSQCGRSEGS